MTEMVKSEVKTAIAKEFEVSDENIFFLESEGDIEQSGEETFYFNIRLGRYIDFGYKATVRCFKNADSPKDYQVDSTTVERAFIYDNFTLGKGNWDFSY